MYQIRQTLMCADGKPGLQASRSGASNLSWSFITSEDLRRAQAKLRSGRGRSAFRRSHSMRVAAGLRTLLPMPLALANVPTFLFIARVSIFLGAFMAWARYMVPRDSQHTKLTLRMHWPEHPPPASAHCRLTVDIPPSPSQSTTNGFVRHGLQTSTSQPSYVVGEEGRLDGATKAFTGTSACRTVAH